MEYITISFNHLWHIPSASVDGGALVIVTHKYRGTDRGKEGVKQGVDTWGSSNILVDLFFLLGS